METWAGVFDPLSARLARAAGYDGLWVSSLSLSAARLGVPDDGQISPDLLVDAISAIAKVVSLPQIVDFENGFGQDAEGMAAIAASFMDAGANGICIEDSIGDKQCSLWEGIKRDLRPVEEMTDVLRTLVATVHSRGGRVVARTESLIEGHGVDAAEERVRAYADAGCWGVVVHFREHVENVFEVARRCAGLTRLVIIPTKAPEVTIAQAQRGGFSVYVVANVAVRAAARAEQRALRTVLANGQLLAGLEDCMPLDELDGILGRGDGESGSGETAGTRLGSTASQPA